MLVLILLQMIGEINLMDDSLKITQNDDGSFQMEWDKEDPNWKFLNNLTSAEIQVIMKEAIQDKLNQNDA
jgi:hypothetical protein